MGATGISPSSSSRAGRFTINMKSGLEKEDMELDEVTHRRDNEAEDLVS